MLFTTIMLTPTKKNVDVVKEYIWLAYSPEKNEGRQTVQHLCHDDAYCVARTTFLDCKSPQDHAESHPKVMTCVSNLKLTPTMLSSQKVDMFA